MPSVDSTCEEAYYYILAQGCEQLLIIPGRDEQLNTDDDVDWILWCDNVQTSGFYKLDLDCAMTKPTCREIETCL